MKWICCQIGAREHYAIPRALHRARLLELLLTDAWVRPGSFWARLKAGLGQRFNSELESARVAAPNLQTMIFEFQQRVASTSDWSRVMRRNQMFQDWAVERLQQIPSDGRPRTLFAYSYAASKLFRFARGRGWQTVLGQIDPGLAEERIVQALHEREGARSHGWSAAPHEYWENWKEECQLSDRIVVNSNWAKEGLSQEGVKEEKISVIPLAFEVGPGQSTKQVPRVYPERFTLDRPLRVLFLGQLNLRKGVLPLLEAVRQMREEPVEFWFVGPDKSAVAKRIEALPNARWFGAVSRDQVSEFYRAADVFILPTFSDGFALTQLEATYHRLPMIVSERCGEVVRDGIDGLILKEISEAGIVDALTKLIREPHLLGQLVAAIGAREEFGLKALERRLINLFS